MPWVVVDPDANKPTLIGSRWQRRAPEGDAWDEVVIRGVFDLGNDSGGLEYVVSPASFGPALTTPPESLTEGYARAEGDDVTERLAARLRDLEARHA
jgi:hypothetical protein